MQANTRMAGRPAAARVGGARQAFAGRKNVSVASRGQLVPVLAVRDGQKLDRKLRVAVVGGGPAGACAADDLAKGGVETFMFERKLDNCKVCSLHGRSAGL
jgi:geranylgeranyl diphosphate/geranylgeranyl-bacteriochlorophyllide a reductase